MALNVIGVALATGSCSMYFPIDHRLLAPCRSLFPTDQSTIGH